MDVVIDKLVCIVVHANQSKKRESFDNILRLKLVRLERYLNSALIGGLYAAVRGHVIRVFIGITKAPEESE